MIISEIQGVLKDQMWPLRASSCTFYVQDPWWPGEMRLVAMPKVKYKEPMQGFLLPVSARENVTAGKEEEKYWSDVPEADDGPILKRLVQKNPLFGRFAQREGVKSRARFIRFKKSKDEPEAVLFVNFEHRIPEFGEGLKRSLRKVMKSVVKFVPFAMKELQKERPFPQILRLFQSAEEHLDFSIEENFQRILSLAIEVSGLNNQDDIGTVYLYDPKREVTELVAAVGNVDAEFQRKYRLLRVDQGEGLVSWVALRRQELLIDDLAKSKYGERGSIYVKTRQGIRSELAVPILAGDLVVGVLNLESARPRAFSPQCLRAIWCVANHCAATYRPAAMMQELLRICSGTPKSAASLNRLAEVVRDYQHADYCDIWRCEPSGSNFAIVAGTDQGNPPVRSAGWSKEIQKTKTYTLLSNIKGEGEFDVLLWDEKSEQWRSPLSREGLPSLSPVVLASKLQEALGVPIILEQDCIGVVWLKYKALGHIQQLRESMKNLSGFAGTIAMVLGSTQAKAGPGFAATAEMGETIIPMVVESISEAKRPEAPSGA